MKSYIEYVHSIYIQNLKIYKTLVKCKEFKQNSFIFFQNVIE